MTEQSEKKFEIHSFVNLENAQERIDKAGLSETQLKDFYENLQGFFVDESEKIVEEYFNFFHSGEYILPVGNFCYRYDNGEIVRFVDDDIVLLSFVKPNNAIEVVVPINLENKINFGDFPEKENEIVNAFKFSLERELNYWLEMKFDAVKWGEIGICTPSGTYWFTEDLLIID
jgi:hypothetical protein